MLQLSRARGKRGSVALQKCRVQELAEELERRERTGVGRVERIEPTSTQWDGRVDDVGMSSGWVD